MGVPASLFSATASSSADTTMRHHRKCDRAESATEPFDLHLRSRQKQEQGPDGGWLLTDTRYNGTGQTESATAPCFAKGTLGDQPIIVPDGMFNGQTTYVYDGADRPTDEIFSVAGDERWRAKTR